jgi:ABC-2 type transport system ATP-binding protein
VEGLSKRFGELHAVQGVSFGVARGEAVGFLGPNGAGKTTTFRMLTGALAPTSGRVRIDGVELEARPRAAKRRTGYMAESVPLHPELTAREYLEFRAELRGLRPARARRAAAERAAERAGLGDHLEVRIAHLSRGYRQRLGLAEVLLGDPPLLLLDEPTAGLDPNQIHDVRRLIRELASEHAVLLSTHVLSEVEAVCDRAIVLSRGAIAASGTLAELSRARSSGKTRVCARGAPAELRAALALPEDWPLETGAGGALCVSVDAPGEAIARLVGGGLEVLSAQLERAPLDEVFRQLTVADAAAKGAP